VFTVRIKKLVISEMPLKLETLDPRVVFRDLAAKSTIFYSNNMPFWMGSSSHGKAQKVLTADEYQRSMATIGQGDPATVMAKKKVVRGVFVGLFMIAAGIGSLLMLKKQQKES
jgi:hypothetical protein